MIEPGLTVRHLQFRNLLLQLGDDTLHVFTDELGDTGADDDDNLRCILMVDVDDLLFEVLLPAEDDLALLEGGPDGEQPRRPAEHGAHLVAEGAGLGAMEYGYHPFYLA